MATRNRVQRGEDAKAPGIFEGRVRKWRKQWMTAGPTREGQRLLFSVWRPTEERGAPYQKRANLVPVEVPHIKPPMPRFGAVPEAKGPKRGRASLSGLGTEDRSATPAMSDGVSLGVTQKTEGATAPKIIRFKLKSSATIASAATGPPAAGGGTPLQGSIGNNPAGAPAAGAGSAPRPAPIRIRIAPTHAQQPLQQAVQQQPPGADSAATQSVPPAPATAAPSEEGGEAESDDLLAELSRMEPHEAASPRNLDELIPDAAAAARHDATAVLLAQQSAGQDQPAQPSGRS
ncbi:hypothetical protein N2152v2_008089 [Parachlorella kessleri]